MPANSSHKILTVPNAISFARILLIPVVVVLIVQESTRGWGILLLGIVVGTDWIDGRIARKYNQVSELGKILDPTADRLIIAAGLIALVAIDAFPLWAAVLVIARDLFFMLVWIVLLSKHLRIDVRYIGKTATFMLMLGIPLIAWGNLGFWAAPTALVVGWMSYVAGVVEYYIAAGLYMGDLRVAFQQAQEPGKSA